MGFQLAADCVVELLTCCGFVVELVVQKIQQILDKSNEWSLSFNTSANTLDEHVNKPSDMDIPRTQAYEVHEAVAQKILGRLLSRTRELKINIC